MNAPAEVLILSASPIYRQSLKQLLELDPSGCHAFVLGVTGGTEQEPVTRPDVVVLAPHTWEEMASWVTFAERNFPLRPWLLFADLRVIGMFLSKLERQRCAPLALDAPPEQLWQNVSSLAGGYGSPLAAQLMTLFARGAAMTATTPRTRFPSPMELQCACAVSFGLGNREISRLLHLSEATVKSHVHHLLQKLGLPNRTELGTFVHHALTPATPLTWH